MKSITVLIVDDDHDVADSLAALVRVLGYRCFAAYDVEAGLKLAESVLPDLVIHDIALPGLSGYDAARRVRDHPLLRNVFLLAHTAYDTEQDQQRALDAGFDQHMGKPIEAEYLRALLGNITRKHRET